MTFATNASTDADPLARQRLYRRLFVGLITGGAAIAITLREFLGYPLAGEAVYWLAILAALAVWHGTSLTLFDERDAALERRDREDGARQDDQLEGDERQCWWAARPVAAVRLRLLYPHHHI